ncbi:MAG: cobalt-precorrin-6A reductase [Pseudomonadota bacterium]
MSILVLGGTAEARALCAELSQRGLPTIASLAGVTTLRTRYPVPLRVGGFGGAEGLATWLRCQKVTAVIDATHPFAAKMPWHAASAAKQIGTPRLRLLRTAWPPRQGWIIVPDLVAAADTLPVGAHAFLSTGRTEVAAFAARGDVRFTLRSIEPPGDLPPHIASVVARPPFTVDAEVETLTRLEITHLVSKNSGGKEQAKLEAAARLGLPVVMISRPPQPDGPSAAKVADAVAWAVKTVDI